MDEEEIYYGTKDTVEGLRAVKGAAIWLGFISCGAGFGAWYFFNVPSITILLILIISTIFCSFVAIDARLAEIQLSSIMLRQVLQAHSKEVSRINER